MFSLHYEVYSLDQIDEVLEKIGIPHYVRNNKRISYYNIPCSFDIESTSFEVNINGQEEPAAIMYEWTLCLYGYIIIGRRWSEFQVAYNKIIEHFDLSLDKRLLIYVHNLSFEFQFMRKRFNWHTVFSIKERKPVKALTEEGVEFRCSYLLSGYSLEKLGEQLVKYKVNKLIGNLDYSKKRHYKTELTDAEIQYCVNDCLVVVAYIQELIERDNGVLNIPLTKTGYVRQYCRKLCYYGEGKRDNNQYHRYCSLMNRLRLDVDTYKAAKDAFMGGFTHANPYYSGEILKDVSSFDFTSSYPYVMVSEKFPMSTPELIPVKTKEDFEYNLHMYCCLFTVEIEGLESKIFYDNYIPESHCKELRGYEVNNGRVVNAKHLIITITEQDWFIIRRYYEWKRYRVLEFRRFQKEYLPTPLVKSILQLYVDKTQLKDVAGKEVEYMNSKEKVNACYGMMVTDICRDEIVYENEDWDKEQPDIEEAISKYNMSKNRFLYYPWGIWVTAYARKNLFTGIYEFGEDYVYSDTDSVKGMNMEKHMPYIERYNASVLKKLKEAMDYHELSIEMTRPKTIRGEEKQLGIWDYEGTYDRFKTLGAKRYMFEKKGKLNLTVSGVNKKKAVPYLQKVYGDKVFEEFKDNLTIPSEYTGKMIHTYIDEPRSGYMTDYNGVKVKYKEYSGTHLANSEYSLSISAQYVAYLLGIKQDAYE